MSLRHRVRTLLTNGWTRVGAVAAVAMWATTGSVSATSPDDAPLFVYERGVLAPADGSFEVAFSSTPTYRVDDAGVSSLVAWTGSNSETVMFFPPDAFTDSDTPDSATGAGDRADRFARSSGSDIELLANTVTRLGPFEAAYFVARLVLNDGIDAVVHGAVVLREGDVTFVVFTDRGGGDPGTSGDDTVGEQARAFVESYTLLFDEPPSPPDSDDSDSGDEAGVTTSFDGAWSVAFPDADIPTLRASSADGFAFAEYHARADNGDHAYVRVTELPPGYTGEPIELFAALPGPDLVDADRLDHARPDAEGQVEVAAVDVGGQPATVVTFQPDVSRPRTITVLAIVARAAGGEGATRLITAAYVDLDGRSQDAATAFVESFTLTDSA